ncbi:MAG: DUF192 domain-containing protein [Chloroflexi bacterium]|nr:DUF192 domain-containing protein [Chloroflexota bacterium]
MKLYHVDRQCLIVHNLEIARDVRSRTRGLIGHAPLEPGQALLLPHSRWIHTFGMSFPIDVIYVDGKWRIVALTENLPPRRIDRPVLRAQGVIEMKAGEIRRLGLSVGEHLELRP